MLDETDSLFYGENQSPLVIVTTEIDEIFMDNNANLYNHINIFFPGQLGWNIRNGPATTYAKVINNYETNNLNQDNNEQVTNTIGGEITILPGDFQGQAKELYGRRTYMDDVSSRASFMNSSNWEVNLIDRAIYKLDRNNEKNQYTHRVDFYDLNKVKDSL